MLCQGLNKVMCIIDDIIDPIIQLIDDLGVYHHRRVPVELGQLV